MCFHIIYNSVKALRLYRGFTIFFKITIEILYLGYIQLQLHVCFLKPPTARNQLDVAIAGWKSEIISGGID